MIDIKDYNKRALEGNPEEMFGIDRNGTTIVLLRTLFNNFNKSAKIAGTSLCSKIISDKECRSRLDMFDSPVKIILTGSQKDIPSNVRNYFSTHPHPTFEIKETNSYLTHAFETGEKEVEFLVLNDIAYFFEHNLKSNITSGKGARCSFNNPEGALHLSSIFDEVYNKQ